MPVEHLKVKSNWVIWRNINLPHPNKSCRSADFWIEGLNYYIHVQCEWISHQERWKFQSMRSGGTCSCTVIPYIQTTEEYVRTNMQFHRSDLSSTYKILIDKITMLFFFGQEYLTRPLDLIKEPIQAIEEDYSDEESIMNPSPCLVGLSKDIGQLFNEKEYSDATLKCGDKSFAIHKNILVARSEVFSAMFKHDMSEKNSGIVTIEDLDPNILEQFLRYLYSGCIEEMSMDIVFELYKAADKYAVLTLKKLCSSYILENISENIICKVLLLADEAGDVEFLNHVASFAAKAKGFLKSAEWKDFAKEHSNVAVEVYFKCHI